MEAGADDYVVKPFGTGELLARLRVAKRHADPSTGSPFFSSGGLEVDLAARTVKLHGTEVNLTGREYSLLRLLVRHAGKVLTHRQILREVWGIACVEHVQYLRVHVARLREKLESDPSQPALIVTEPGVGYRFHAGN